jgi:hypothetical protein
LISLDRSKLVLPHHLTMATAALGTTIFCERTLRRALIVVAVLGLAAGLFARIAGDRDVADLVWSAATVPVAAGLLVSIVRDLDGRRRDRAARDARRAGAWAAAGRRRCCCDVFGGNLLEDIAVARAEHDLRTLVDRAPRMAHRERDHAIEDIPVGDIAIGDPILVRAGEVIPVGGIISADSATIDESAVTGEPIPVLRTKGAPIASGAHKFIA